MRIYNFSAGPAVMPEEVLEEAKGALWDLDDSGIGVLEHSHRGKAFRRVIEAAEADCRELAGVPDDYRVLFLQGGASTQFYMLPANFLPKDGTADYLDTGSWSSKAIKEARSRYGLLYAGAQKNLGPAGVTLVLIRAELLERTVRQLPTMLRYATHAEGASLYNTPPSFGIYVMGLVFKWILAQGGLAEIGRRNEDKARLLYDVIDAGDFFRGTARPDSRSLMNVTFRTPSEELDARFLAESEATGFSGLKGHRSVGGMRASIYNAFPPAGCEALAQFMKDFASKNG
jgi:phosphoserine aminotransferase